MGNFYTRPCILSATRWYTQLNFSLILVIITLKTILVRFGILWQIFLYAICIYKPMTKLWIFTIVLDRLHIYLHWNSLKMLINIRITYFFFPFNNNSCIAVFGKIVQNAANIPIPQPRCLRYELLLYYVWTTYGIKRIYFRRFSITKYFIY